MHLHIRLFTNFWTHRKTLRLQTLIGNDAFWVPPKLWSYAAQNQPDGDFSGYKPEELGMLLGCSSNASSMLQALQDAGFMDGMKIHDWEEHNAYHHTFSKRARNAALARWAKEESSKEEREERKGKEQALLKHAPSIPEGAERAMNGHLPKVSPMLSPVIPQSLRTLEFQKVWATWSDYCKSEHKDPKKLAIMFNEQLEKLDKMGVDSAIAALKNTMSNGYKGIIEPKNAVKPKPIRYGSEFPQ